MGSVRLFRLLTVAILGLAIGRLLHGLVLAGWTGWIGHDVDIYTEATRRVLSGGSWYLERQLHGRYDIASGDVLYPPTAVYLFIPWLVLPSWTFAAVPIVVTAWVVRRLRPAVWAWPLLALCLVWPDTMVMALSANPGVWAMMALALGMLYRWPAALVLLKPTLAPFALFGIRSRGWWVSVGALAVLTLPVLGDALRYPSVALSGNSERAFYSLWDLPFMAVPVVAWLGRRRTRESQEDQVRAQGARSGVGVVVRSIGRVRLHEQRRDA